MNYQTEYLEDNAITKKEYPNFPKFICFFVTQIGFAQFTIPENNLTSVYDYANVLSATEKAQLEN
jgi:hypothetical protein